MDARKQAKIKDLRNPAIPRKSRHFAGRGGFVRPGIMGSFVARGGFIRTGNDARPRSNLARSPGASRSGARIVRRHYRDPGSSSAGFLKLAREGTESSRRGNRVGPGELLEP